MAAIAEYIRRHQQVLVPLANALEVHLQGLFNGTPRIDRIQCRAKALDRFAAKATKIDGDKRKYEEPLHQIQDQVGARIIVFYLEDVDRIAAEIAKYMRPVESKDLLPESEWEFGYFGKHFVLLFPTELIDPQWDPALVPEFFELQVKTLFQHAWSEANHDLGYKPGGAPLDSQSQRQMAFTSAQAWGADQIFDELFKRLSKI